MSDYYGGRGRGRGRGRGDRGRGRGRGGGGRGYGGGYRGGFDGGYQQGSRGGYRGGGYQGQGHATQGGFREGGFRGDRGERRGGGRARGSRGGGQLSRWHDQANPQLKQWVKKANEDDMTGTQQVRVWSFAEGGNWRLVESLSRGEAYYYDQKSGKSLELSKAPKDVEGKEVSKEQPFYQEQSVDWPLPPKAWPKMRLLDRVRTNSYDINEDLLRNRVRMYLVEFDPPISTEQVNRRRKVLYGETKAQEKKNRNIMYENFGYYVFDNHQLYSMGGKLEADFVARGQKADEAPPVFDLHPNYKVIFKRQDAIDLENPDIPLSQQAQLLNIFQRKRLGTAGFTRVGKGWFLKKQHQSDEVGEDTQMKDQELRDCTIMMGYECSIQVHSEQKTNKRCAVFKADMASKCVTRLTVGEIIAQIREKNQNEPKEAFRRAVEDRLLDRHFVMKYNTQSRRILKVDWEQNENSTFTLKTGGKISYKEYLKRQYNLESRHREDCVIIDSEDSGYLPQHMKLTMRSDEMRDFYDQVLESTNLHVRERLNRSDALVKHLNKAEEQNRKRGKVPEGKGKDDEAEDDEGEDEEKAGYKPNRHVQGMSGFGIMPRGRVVKAAMLNYPDLTFMGKNNQTITESVKDLQWKNTGGFLDTVIPLANWAIVYDQSEQHVGDSLYEHWQTYCGMRRFHPEKGPIREPRMIEVDFSDIPQAVKQSEGKYQILLVVLPSRQGGMYASEVKNRFTKGVQNARQAGNACLVQCIQGHNANNKNAAIGTFEDMMGKIGNVLYRIEPNFELQGAESRAKLFTEDTWVMGLDVSHVGGKPSVAMLCLSRKPLLGTSRYLNLVAHLNEERREVVPFKAMATMTFEALSKAWESEDVRQNVNKLPKAIIVFRDGVPDNRLRELYSKEVVGILRGLRVFKQFKKAEAWKPKVNFLVSSKSILDRFGVEAQGGVEHIGCPAVVFDGITSSRVWDFILYGYHPKKAAEKTRPIRYIVLRDELQLAQSKSGPDLWQFIYALSFTVHFSIPFPTGGTSETGPVKLAKHYAEQFSQMVTRDDRSAEDVNLSRSLNTRPTVVSRQLSLNTNIVARPVKSQKQKPDVQQGQAQGQGQGGGKKQEK